MLHIYNKTISKSNSILYALTILYGINKYQSKNICKQIGINPQINLNKVKTYHVNRLIKYINENLKIEQFLKKRKKDNLKELLEIKLLRGIRLSQGLPVRGQRTHTNAKTSRKFKNISKKQNYDFKKKKNLILKGNLYIKSNLKNTIISLTKINGNLLKQWSTKSLKKTNFKKNNPYNIQLITYQINNFIKHKKIKKLNVFFKGSGLGHHVLRNLNKQKLKIFTIFNTISIPFNGCRKKKMKRR